MTTKPKNMSNRRYKDFLKRLKKYEKVSSDPISFCIIKNLTKDIKFLTKLKTEFTTWHMALCIHYDNDELFIHLMNSGVNFLDKKNDPIVFRFMNDRNYIHKRKNEILYNSFLEFEKRNVDFPLYMLPFKHQFLTLIGGTKIIYKQHGFHYDETVKNRI